MTRRFSDFRSPLPYYTPGEKLLVASATFIGVAALLALIWLGYPTKAHGHDFWANGKKNPAGEYCCGATDCGVVDPKAIKAVQGGYSVRGMVTGGAEVTGNVSDGPTWTDQVNEIVPYSEAMPSPDGAYWRCHRPDKARRCFFAPPPNG